ncbi:MAG: Trk system potassium transporter TrkA [Blastopirellula sp.]|nr:Trk system potassium transporter TrkA [Blastopirellula sp.]
MRVVTLGAGTVGSWIAELLCQHRHSVTVVDNNPAHVARVNELDVRTITGSASQSSVLFQADVAGADLVLAVTGIDEVNLVASSMAKRMGARRVVSRVYAPVFHDPSTFPYQRHFGIDRMLSLEHLSATELARNIRSPGSMLLENFGQGDIEVQEVVVSSKAGASGTALKDLKLPSNVRVGSICRGSKTWIAGATDVVEGGDHITIIGEHATVDTVKGRFQNDTTPRMGVVIAGGGETGLHLAMSLERDRFDVFLLEESEERCNYLARMLDSVTVIHADATRRAVLEEERVGSADVFVACTGDDENNIMAGVEAREIGAKKILALVGRPDYATIVGKLGIDHAVSQRDVMARQVMGFLNMGCVISRSSLPGGRIAVLEIEVDEHVDATEHVLANLPLPEKCLIATVIRDGFSKVPGADDRLQAGDTVIALVEDSESDALLRLFSPN